MTKMTLAEELTWRGFVNQTTFKDITEINKPQKFYFGVDPNSADSMTIGNLAGINLVRHLIAAGHEACLLIGGATGLIGDPKDDEEREAKSKEEVAKNKAGIVSEYKRLLKDDKFTVVDNLDWFKDIKYLDFLRDIGKNFSMTQLLDRDFVKSRIGAGKSGISYAEFSYSLLQGYDFLYLYRTHGITLQVGGSDQWGNMISGVPLIRKLENAEVNVWTLPLVINQSTGRKFGKSEAGAVWLSPDKTSPYQFYQFWLNVDDEGVEYYLKIYTFITPDELSDLMQRSKADPGAREAQKYLAYEVTKLVHGEAKAQSARKVTSTLFGDTPVSQLLEADIEMLAAEIPSVTSDNVLGALVAAGVAKSNGEANRLITQGAVSVNGEKIDSNQDVSTPSLIKKGKNTFILVK